MHNPFFRKALPVTGVAAAVLSLVACGGGGDAASDALAQAQAADDAGRAQVLATAAAPAVGSIALASSNAAGAPRGGSLCAISADGSIVSFTSDSSTLVAGTTGCSSCPRNRAASARAPTT